uniref:Ig-like domain-containing protein n=1 Tax=Ailuropoda melanoleuca TaxID=9646 RepID=A0A7N5KK14_AILME
MWACTDHFSVTPKLLHGKKEEHYLGDTAEMKCSPGFVTAVLLMLGQTQGDSVTQSEGQLTLLEKESLTINCTFSTTWSPTLFWYVQHPGEGLQLLLKAMKEKEKGINKGFEATYDKDSKSFHLEKGSVQASDSAVYYCAMSDTVTGTTGGAERKL